MTIKLADVPYSHTRYTPFSRRHSANNRLYGIQMKFRFTQIRLVSSVHFWSILKIVQQNGRKFRSCTEFNISSVRVDRPLRDIHVPKTLWLIGYNNFIIIIVPYLYIEFINVRCINNVRVYFKHNIDVRMVYCVKSRNGALHTVLIRATTCTHQDNLRHLANYIKLH